MFSKIERFFYEKNQLTEVICQLRFPTILSVGANEPVEFQEAVRAGFPRYLVSKDQLPPRVGGGNTPAPVVEPQQSVTNYHFVSENGMWRLNLTNHFIALTCRQYTSWEEFARMLDQPLADFIRIYRPSFFERVGLRYLNAISRTALGLTGTSWSELIEPAYLGLLGEEDLTESCAMRCTQDAELTIPGGCRLKLHAGPGVLRKGGQSEDKEVKFILDLDFSMSGSLPAAQTAPVLQTLHMNATPIFRSALTDTLHDAMLPTEL